MRRAVLALAFLVLAISTYSSASSDSAVTVNSQISTASDDSGNTLSAGVQQVAVHDSQGHRRVFYVVPRSANIKKGSLQLSEGIFDKDLLSNSFALMTPPVPSSLTPQQIYSRYECPDAGHSSWIGERAVEVGQTDNPPLPIATLDTSAKLLDTNLYRLATTIHAGALVIPAGSLVLLRDDSTLIAALFLNNGGALFGTPMPLGTLVADQGRGYRAEVFSPTPVHGISARSGSYVYFSGLGSLKGILPDADVTLQGITFPVADSSYISLAPDGTLEHYQTPSTVITVAGFPVTPNTALCYDSSSERFNLNLNNDQADQGNHFTAGSTLIVHNGHVVRAVLSSPTAFKGLTWGSASDDVVDFYDSGDVAFGYLSQAAQIGGISLAPGITALYDGGSLKQGLLPVGDVTIAGVPVIGGESDDFNPDGTPRVFHAASSFGYHGKTLQRGDQFNGYGLVSGTTFAAMPNIDKLLDQNKDLVNGATRGMIESFRGAPFSGKMDHINLLGSHYDKQDTSISYYSDYSVENMLAGVWPFPDCDCKCRGRYDVAWTLFNNHFVAFVKTVTVGVVCGHCSATVDLLVLATNLHNLFYGPPSLPLYVLMRSEVDKTTQTVIDQTLQSLSNGKAIRPGSFKLTQIHLTPGGVTPAGINIDYSYEQEI